MWRKNRVLDHSSAPHAGCARQGGVSGGFHKNIDWYTRSYSHYPLFHNAPTHAGCAHLSTTGCTHLRRVPCYNTGARGGGDCPSYTTWPRDVTLRPFSTSHLPTLGAPSKSTRALKTRPMDPSPAARRVAIRTPMATAVCCTATRAALAVACAPPQCHRREAPPRSPVCDTGSTCTR